MMAALLRQGARRIGRSVLQQTQAAVTSPAVAEERRRLVTRHLTTAPQPARTPRTPYQEYLEKKYGPQLKLHHFCWELIKLFPAGKAAGLVAMTTGTVAFVSATRELGLERREAEKKEKAQKKREQSASKRQEAEKREH